MRNNKFSEKPDGFGAVFQESKIPVFSASGTARLLLAFTALYIVFASLAVCLAEVQGLRFFNIYYLAMAGLCSLYAVSSLREVSFYHQSSLNGGRGRYALIILGLGLVAWGLYRYPHLFSFSLWLDEITQFQGDWSLPRRVVDPALFAAIQQQPPIDYYLSAFARIIFGMTEFAALMHTIAFGILSFFVFLVWLIQIRFPLALAPVPILLFAAHHSLLRFSSEARPVSLGVFFALLTLIFTYESVQRKKVCTGALGISALLLLYSIGLQPMFFLAILAVGLLPLLFRHLERAEAAKLLLALSVVPLVLFSPTLWEIYRESERQNQFFPSSYLELCWNALRSLRWKSFWSYQRTIEHATWIFFIPFIVLAIAFVMRALRYRKFPVATASWALAGAIFAVLFPLVFQIFWSIVNWNLNLYYFVLWPVGLLGLGSLCVALLLRPFLEEKRRVWLAIALAPFGAAGAYELHRTYVPGHRAKIELNHSYRPNWHTIINKARQATRPALIIGVPYGKFGWPPYHEVAGSFYEDPPKIRLVRMDIRNKFGIPAFRVWESIGALNQPVDLFYVMTLVGDVSSRAGDERRQRILSVFQENADEVTKLGKRTYLVRINDQDSPINTTKSLFEKIIEADPGGDKNFYLADILASGSIRRADCGAAMRWLGVMELADAKPTTMAEPRHKNLEKYLAKVKDRIDMLACGENLVRADGSRGAATISGAILPESRGQRNQNETH